MMTITTFDMATGIVTEEELSKELIAERAKELKAIQDAKNAEKASREAIFAKLNLTADEAAILLG